jgi:hypothetical protein
LAATLVSQNGVYRSAVVDWFVDGSKKWKQERYVSCHVELVLSTLKACEPDVAQFKKFGHRVFRVFWRHLQDNLCNTNDDNQQKSATLLIYLAEHFANHDELSDCWCHLREVIQTTSLPLMPAVVQTFADLLPICATAASGGSETDDSAARKKQTKSLAVELISACITALSTGTNNPTVDQQLMTSVLDAVKNCTCFEDVECLSLRDGLSASWNQFVTTSLRCHFTNAKMLQVLDSLVQLLYPLDGRKISMSDDSYGRPEEVMPLTVLSVFEMVISHSAFMSTILCEGSSEVKDKLVSLLYSLVTRDIQCCQTSHLAVYFTAYHATLSTTDQQLLLLIQFYEQHGCDVTEYRPFLWGEKCLEYQTLKKTIGKSLWKQPTTEEVLELLDKCRLQQSVVQFPVGRSLRPKATISDPKILGSEVMECYDPAFLLPLFAHLIAPECVVHCTDFAARHCLSFVISALSSHADDTRRVAYHILKMYYGHLEGAVGQHQYTVPCLLLYMLDCLRNSVTQQNERLPCIITTFLAHAAHLLTTPEDHMFLPVCEFLLLKPNLDLTNAPEFYKLFFSSQIQYKQERSWILGVIADGLREPVDYEICQRRFMLKILLTFYDSPLSDTQTQSLVMKILLKMCSIKVVAWDLVKNRGILSWLTHVSASMSETRINSLLLVVSALWNTLLDNRDDSLPPGQKRAPPPCLPPLFTAEMILLVEALKRDTGTICTDTTRDTLNKILKSVKAHAQKTQKLYTERSYLNPIPESFCV